MSRPFAAVGVISAVRHVSISLAFQEQTRLDTGGEPPYASVELSLVVWRNEDASHRYFTSTLYVVPVTRRGQEAGFYPAGP